jgi:hypothetical protein
MPQPTYGIQNKTVPTTNKRWGRFSEALPDRIPGLTSGLPGVVQGPSRARDALPQNLFGFFP